MGRHDDLVERSERLIDAAQSAAVGGIGLAILALAHEARRIADAVEELVQQRNT